MTFLKQTIAMALCLLMLAALAACGTQQKPAEAGPAQEPENDAAPVLYFPGFEGSGNSVG